MVGIAVTIAADRQIGWRAATVALPAFAIAQLVALSNPSSHAVRMGIIEFYALAVPLIAAWLVYRQSARADSARSTSALVLVGGVGSGLALWYWHSQWAIPVDAPIGSALFPTSMLVPGLMFWMALWQRPTLTTIGYLAGLLAAMESSTILALVLILDPSALSVGRTDGVLAGLIMFAADVIAMALLLKRQGTQWNPLGRLPTPLPI
ncbi:hypothetical protein ACIHDR_24240 [Nocardia sp. NPDC052278]|uniref:hypothetical protein n=1 Tax=unclassified Nocardia TaxID=2637762 RepID=UPI0036B4037A